jgi:hypothetical protein
MRGKKTMEASIWKYPLEPRGEHRMPVGAKILTVQIQAGVPVLWAMVNPDAIKETRIFSTVPTGRYFDPTDMEYIGTFQAEELVSHVFEKKTV